MYIQIKHVDALVRSFIDLPRKANMYFCFVFLPTTNQLCRWGTFLLISNLHERMYHVFFVSSFCEGFIIQSLGR